MVSTYIAVIVVTLVLMYIYVIGLLTQNLYNNEETDMFAKANIISEIVSDRWGDNMQLSELRFEDVVEKSLAGTNIRGVITDTAYTVIYDTNKESAMVGKVFMRDVLKRAVDGVQNEDVREVEGLKLVSVAVPVERHGNVIGGVYLAKTVSGIEDTISLTSTSLIAFSVIIVFLIGMLSFGLSYIITSPLGEFVRVAKEISRGNFQERVHIKGHNEMMQLGETLNYMCDELSLFEEKRRKFVSDASHELKTPMAGIKLICDSLVQAKNPDIDTVKEFLADMSAEVDRLTRIINRLLVLTKFDSADMNLKLEETDINLMLDTILKQLSQMASSKQIELKRLYDASEPITVVLDYDKIYEAIYNIIDNAIKYTYDCGYVKVDMQVREGFVVIKIEDNGPGIPESERERVFDRFYRVDDSRSRETGGTGLGLSISKEAVSMHGGRIEITQAPEGGSIFTVILPCSAENENYSAGGAQ